MTATQPANADQALIHEFLARGGSPLRAGSNPLAIALNMEVLAVSGSAGHVELAFDPDPLFVQGTGVLQGGAVSAMLDFAMAFAVMASVERGMSCATVSMTTNFQRPAPAGRYRALGLVERCGKSHAFANAKLLRADSEGAMVATGISCLALF